MTEQAAPTVERAGDGASSDAGTNGEGNGHEPEAEISVKGLTKSFGKQTVLEDITCDIPKGKVTLMLGPSGTGKSVFLKHLMGLLRPDRGEIWVGDKNLPDLSSRELYKVRRKFGVLFQDGALFGSMNIYDNTAFPLREHTRKSEKEIRDIVEEKLKMVGLTGAENKLPGEISGGMKKRAGLARALVLDPEIVLFDEPDSGLDPVRTAFLNELILDLNRQLGATFIVVTHDIATARRVADYIGMLYLRNLVQFGSNKAMFESDIPVVKQFLAGATKGPIGMSEEADAGRNGPEDARSSSGMTAEETERMERDAGALSDRRRDDEGQSFAVDGRRDGTDHAAAQSSHAPTAQADASEQPSAHDTTDDESTATKPNTGGRSAVPDADEAADEDGAKEDGAKEDGGVVGVGELLDSRAQDARGAEPAATAAEAAEADSEGDGRDDGQTAGVVGRARRRRSHRRRGTNGDTGGGAG